MSKTPSKTLQQVLDETARQRQWSKSMCSQAQQAITTLNRSVHAEDDYALKRQASAVWSSDIHIATAAWYASGLAPATIQKRLVALKCMGLPVEGVKAPKDPRKLKWWLRPEEEEKALVWLRQFPDAGNRRPRGRLADHIEWTTKTGLRIEETLALTPLSFSADFTEVMVPGLKTASSQATLPISPAVGELGAQLVGWPTPTTYEDLLTAWNAIRSLMGWPPEATLKSLRRSAARYLHYDLGMPLDLVRQYLRHEDIATTMGYLRLTGGVSTADYRRYLK